MAKVTGLGGVFFRCADPAATRRWYRDRLGIAAEDYGFAFVWRELERPDERGYTVWNAFPEATEYFAPSGKQFMVNYRVDDLEQLVAELRAAGVEIVGGIDEEENGKFAWILDPDGQKIELWEPVPADRDPYLPPVE
jgi:catechol 2,3-dioxygenase-like lactoylglutathione lyase family enzyme